MNNPIIDDADLALKWLERNLWNLIINWKVADARTQIARDVFTSMEQTKRELEKLRILLIEKLTYENKLWFQSELKAKAQIIIDVLIRNLFERTADIWFLATDDDVRCFLYWNQESREKHSDFITQRLQEYKSRYSVYDDVLIFTPDWDFVVSANCEKNIWNITDSFIKKAQNVKNGSFFEYFGPVSFASGNKLLYTYQITKDNTPWSEVIWVMVLSFDLEKEMEMIFESIDYWIKWAITCLVDEEWKVLSSNIWSTFNGKKIKISLNPSMVKIGNWDYLSFSTSTNGYQWFTWKKWYGHVFLPVINTFDTINQDFSSLDIHDILKSNLVGKDLQKLIEMVDALNIDINHMIINGHLLISRQNNSDADGIRPVFDQVVKISEKCKGVFSQSIWSMFDMVIKNLLNSLKSVSSLWINIMDRNLYERANDVRWWALTSKFRIILEKNNISQREITILQEILVYIHELYTVYDTLYLYDKNGKVIVATKLDKNWKSTPISDLSNFKVPFEWKQVISSKSKKSYVVSKFENTQMYDWKPTYTYFSPITWINSQNVVWWIWIVFDSEPQFQNMLQDVLPKNNWTFWLFIDSHGKIISSTNNEFVVGNHIEIPQNFLWLSQSQSISDTIIIDGKKYLVWATCSSWYREYKKSDWYKNDVICLIFIPL